MRFERDRHLTLVMRDGRGVFGDVAVTYMVVPGRGLVVETPMMSTVGLWAAAEPAKAKRPRIKRPRRLI